MGRWTVTDDDGHVATIEVAGDSMIVTHESGDGRFRTTSQKVAAEYKRAIQAAITELPESS